MPGIRQLFEQNRAWAAATEAASPASFAIRRCLSVDRMKRRAAIQMALDAFKSRALEKVDRISPEKTLARR
jgi:hypothetical protein